MKHIFIFILFLFLIISCDSKDKKNYTSCMTIDDCDSNEICLDKRCQPSKDQCEEKEDCPPGYYCDILNRCAKSVCTDDYCGQDKICENDECIIGCRLNSDCSGKNICKDQKCTEPIDCRETGVTCEIGFKCNIANGECEVNNNCNTNSDCPNGYKCDYLKCTPRTTCNKDTECNEGEFCTKAHYCDIDTGNCDSNEYCINRFQQGKPICNITTGICNECLTDEHCPGDVQCKRDHKCNMPICDRVICQENSYCDPANGECLCNQGFKNENGTCVDICSSFPCEHESQSCIVNEAGEAECILTCYQDQFSTPAANYDRAHAAPITPGEYGPYNKTTCFRVWDMDRKVFDIYDGYCSQKTECIEGACKPKPTCPATTCSNTQTCVEGACYDLCSPENPGKYGYCKDNTKACNSLGECVTTPICSNDSDCQNGEMCLYTGGIQRCEKAPLSLIALNCNYIEDWYRIDLITGQTLKVEIFYNSSGVHNKVIEIHSEYNNFVKRSNGGIDRTDARVEYTARDTTPHYIKIYNSNRNNEAVGYSMKVTIE